jgi:hypothetical protein
VAWYGKRHRTSQCQFYHFEVIRSGKTILDHQGESFDNIDKAWEEATAKAGKMVKELDGQLVAGAACSLAVQDEFYNTIRIINVSIAGPKR